MAVDDVLPLPSFFRRALILGVIALGVGAVTATSPATTDPVFALTSPEKVLDVTLTRETPSLRFAITATSTQSAVVTLRAETDIPDDNAADDPNDGVPVVDVGLVGAADDLPTPIDDTGPSQASVKEGAFAVERALDDGSATLVVRLRDTEARANVHLVLTASSTLAEAPAADDSIELAVEPAP